MDNINIKAAYRIRDGVLLNKRSKKTSETLIPKIKKSLIKSGYKVHVSMNVGYEDNKPYNYWIIGAYL